MFKHKFARSYRCLLIVVVAGVLAACASQPSVPPRSAATSPAIVIDSAKRTEVVMTALALLKTQYQYGGHHPKNGFDCSGLVQFVIAQATQTQLPRTTEQQANISRPIKRDNLRSGDLVFFNTQNRPHSHVGIYVGDGQFINAPSSGGHVRIDNLNNPYFASRFDGARTLYTP